MYLTCGKVDNEVTFDYISLLLPTCVAAHGRCFRVNTFAALLTLSSLPRLWTNTEAGFSSWSTAEYIVRPKGRVRSGSSSMQLRTALLSAPIAALALGPGGGCRERTVLTSNTQLQRDMQ